MKFSNGTCRLLEKIINASIHLDLSSGRVIGHRGQRIAYIKAQDDFYYHLSFVHSTERGRLRLNMLR